MEAQSKVKAMSMEARIKVKARLGHYQGNGKAMSRQRRQVQEKFKTRSGQVDGKVKERFRQGKSKVQKIQGKVERQGQGKINVRLNHTNHNHNHSYNLMGFDTIEINLSFDSK